MIPLDKGLIVKLYSYLCQAQRSLHRAVCNNWSDFQNYYRPDRARGVEEALAALDESISGQRSSPMPDKEDIFKKLPRIGILRYYFGGWLARWKHSFAFTPQEISYTAGKLEAFLELLARSGKPSTDELVDLRMDLSVAEGILNCRCFGLEEFKRARRIEHFDRTEWYPHLQLWEILGETAPDVAPTPPAAKAAG